MKRLLITGAEGFTGRYLVDAAVASGFDVIELKSDLTNAPALEQEILAANPTHVVHLAAISAVTHADESAFYQVNLFGTLNLLKALIALPNPPEKVLLASSANVYGNQVGEISEAVCPEPVNHYAMSKLAMEHMAMTYANRLPLLMVRPFNYTGVGHDQRFVIPKIIDHFKRGAEKIELGNLDVYREYNDVRMVCDAYLRLLEKGNLGEIYNVCTGRAFSLGEVITLAEKLSGHQIEVSVNPMFVRPNEVHTLSGNPQKLESAIGNLQVHSLENTLGWMLASK
jgi:GDP-6-deoxy-D-talose 4-dehydrogenase